MSTGRRHALRRYLGFVCLLLIVTSALALLGWPPTRRLAAAGGVPAMLAGLGVSLLASALGGLPILLAVRRTGAARAQEMMASLVARLFVVLAGVLYVVLMDLVEKSPFIIWVGLSYLLLLPVDIRYALRSGADRRE